MDKQISRNILILDDDTDLLGALEISLREKGQIVSASSVNGGIQKLKVHEIDLAIVDLEFEGQEKDGLIFLDHITKGYPNIPVIVFSGDSNISRILEATRYHLVEFVTKGRDGEKNLLRAVDRGLWLRDMSISQVSKSASFETCSRKMLNVIADIEKLLLSKTQAPILILGESGTGKEVMARYIAARLNKRLITTNMAAIPTTMAESELFGHRRGAFTTAISDKKGLIEEANGGLCFLDEIGDSPLELQAKLLRAIEQGEITPLGDTRAKKVDVRFIAATNCDLNNMIQNDKFRFDLLQRLNTFTITLLPLRERPEDILFYVTKLLETLSPTIRYFLSPEASDALLNHTWPGNVRELRNVIQRVIVMASNRNIQADDIRKAIGVSDFTPVKTPNLPPDSPATPIKVGLSEDDVIRMLHQTNGNRKRAAGLLGVHRATLFRWLRERGLSDVIAGKVGRPALLGVSVPIDKTRWQ